MAFVIRPRTVRPVLALVLQLAFVLTPLGALAQSDGASSPRRDRNKNTVMSEPAYKQLSEAHDLLGEQRYDAAAASLQDMQQRLRLSQYEQALVLQTYGFIYSQQARFDEALDYFERCIALDALPLRAQQGMLYSLAGLYANNEQWLKAVETIERWLVAEPEPPPDGFILIASSYAELKRYRDALPWIKKAIDASDQPKGSWYELMVAMYFELEEFDDAVTTTRKMVAIWPGERKYWELLQAAYQQTGDDFGAMSALELGYRQGALTSEASIVNLARMKMYLEVPMDAAELLTREMRAGRVQRNTKNLELLLASWVAARAFDNAVLIIDELASSAPTGKLYARKAQLFSERNRWEDVIAAAEQALRRGGLTNQEQGTVLLLKGVALLELDRRDAAEAAFTAVTALGGRAAEQATTWIQYLRDQVLTLSAG